jgi:hypothetical protein
MWLCRGGMQGVCFQITVTGQRVTAQSESRVYSISECLPRPAVFDVYDEQFIPGVFVLFPLIVHATNIRTSRRSR